MKWIRERDALIAQTMAFVQSVTGKRDDAHPPETPAAAPEIPAAAPEVSAGIVTVETVAAQTFAIEIEPPQVVPPLPPVIIPPARTGGDFRSEMQARIANFRKHQERFEREREEYCAATLIKLRAAIGDASPRPPVEK
ncbi:hypothetical protein I3J27_23535 [Bradyrhizobium xenonodulans]|uniref:Uncharacterized protein n=1 Tax=Bradyrhizobium xenonodulans TaxID=2736875 RepID=A0ABY7MCE3_9BRAD|nr:hypothetical protein [Bradyrhizobium xenonodulans]WBL75998.1 hypothetical protein I3J27_23535 [Bradyrhizobium xenonodulans]